jgi:hypothetical protein
MVLFQEFDSLTGQVETTMLLGRGHLPWRGRFSPNYVLTFGDNCPTTGKPNRLINGWDTAIVKANGQPIHDYWLYLHSSEIVCKDTMQAYRLDELIFV